VTLAAASALLFREARFLDAGAYEDWLALYTEDCTYWVPAHRAQQTPTDGVAHVHDDWQVMKARVTRLSQPRAFAPEPAPRTCHLVGNVELEAHATAGEFVVHSTLVMLEWRARDRFEDDQRVFGARVTHVLRESAEGLRIRHKRVDLVNAEAAFNALAVPF
jgi:benzoate/toluate 1,2-dioxygenase beta subunit